MKDNRDILEKLRWLSSDMEEMDAPGEWLLPVTQAHSVIFGLREEVERLRVIAAALAAWPSAEIDDSQYGGDFLILPLQEPRT
jgi:hypothetical protein